MNSEDVPFWIHCKKCLPLKPRKKSMQEFSKINVGRTPKGILIFCDRHEEIIAHLKFDWSEIDHLKTCICENCQKNKIL